MVNVGEAIIEKLSQQPEPFCLYIGDTWFFYRVATHNPFGQLANVWVKETGKRIRLTPGVEAEYTWNHGNAALDREGVKGLPKAPKSLELILQDSETFYARREFTKEDDHILANANLSPTDKNLVKEAVEIARKFGTSYVITNDTDLGDEIKDVRTTQKLNIHLILPQLIKREMSYLLPKLEASLIIPDELAVEIYHLVTSRRYTGRPYMVVQRQKPYTFGNTTILTDIAIDVKNAREDKLLPSTMSTYSIPVAVLEDTKAETIRETYPEIIRNVDEQRMIFGRKTEERHTKAIIMSRDKNFFPFLYLLCQYKEADNKGVMQNILEYKELNWIRDSQKP